LIPVRAGGREYGRVVNVDHGYHCVLFRELTERWVVVAENEASGGGHRVSKLDIVRRGVSCWEEVPSDRFRRCGDGSWDASTEAGNRYVLERDGTAKVSCIRLHASCGRSEPTVVVHIVRAGEAEQFTPG